jgi:UDP-N-acetylglucosamine 2-epimerase (non-hydrolysing)
MIDTLIKLLPKALQGPKMKELGLKPNGFILATLHRPSNVDDPDVLRGILRAMAEVSQDLPVIFPVHPRTRGQIQNLNMELPGTTLRLIDPLGYLDFLALMNSAALVVTDSGGVQEETTYLGVPCLTARPNTERPITITEGTNRLVPSAYDALLASVSNALCQPIVMPRKPPLWDGQAASRIAKVILNH